MLHPYDTEITRISDTLRNNGHQDYFDTLIAATALWSCDGIVTEDMNKVRVFNVPLRAECGLRQAAFFPF